MQTENLLNGIRTKSGTDYIQMLQTLNSNSLFVQGGEEKRQVQSWTAARLKPTQLQGTRPASPRLGTEQSWWLCRPSAEQGIYSGGNI